MDAGFLPAIGMAVAVLVAAPSLYLTYRAYSYSQRSHLKMYGYLTVACLLLGLAFGHALISFIGPFQAFPLFAVGIVLLFGAYTVKKNEVDN